MFSGSCNCVCLRDVQRLLLRHKMFAADECEMQWVPSSEPGTTPFVAPCGAVDLGCATRFQRPMGLRAPLERSTPSFDLTGAATDK